MVHRRLRSSARAPLDFALLRAELDVPGPFEEAVLADAAASAARGPAGERVDATDIPLVTIDPPGSMDLDQALAVEARPGGWRVRYAIADVAAWVAPGSPVDVAARARTQTFYAPDERSPLHPPSLGEAAASLLPDGPRPAVLWTIDVGDDGATTDVDVRRAMVRSRSRLDYAGVQAMVDAGGAELPDALRALPELGEVLLAAAAARGAIELGLPEQDVVRGADGQWTVRIRADLPVERWNAQVSLLTGRAAASLMLAGGIGILRTVPQADPAALPRLRRAASNLAIAWPEAEGPATVLRSLDLARPQHAAFAELAAELLRGAAYTAFDRTLPADPGHAGVGAPYAHVTAPLRRLVDRFGTEVCLALAAGDRPPAWAAEALPSLPAAMEVGDRLAKRFERAVVDATEAFVLHDRIGQTFPARVVESGDDYGTVVLDDPPVRARCDTRRLPLGRTVQVRCVEADVATRTVRFERVA
ncbi:MAG: RNB domain-containing ribonuclease [Acidimicrobiales bacterium]